MKLFHTVFRYPRFESCSFRRNRIPDSRSVDWTATVSRHRSRTSPRQQPGNAPTKIPDTQVCKSKMEANFYSVFGPKIDATAAWYAEHLQGFHKIHGYGNQRPKELFYNDAGTMVVSVLGIRGKDGENTEVHSVTYYRFQPGLAAKTIIGISQDKFVCQ